MALVGTIAIAMKVTTKSLEAGFAKARSSVRSFQSSMGSALGLVGGLLAGGAVIGGFSKMITASADLIESASKMQVIFGGASKSITEDATTMATVFGMSKREFYDAASNFGLLFKQMGKSGPELASLSSKWTQLAVDISSFYNVSTKDALVKLHAGLIGESEPLRQLGVFLTENAVKAKAMAMGLAKDGEELSNGAKLQARAALIVGQLSDAMGDKARTALSPANQMRDVWGRVENLLANVGDSILPALGEALIGVNTGIEALSSAWSNNRQAIIEWAIGSTDGTSLARMGVLSVVSVVKTLADTWQVVRLAFTGFVNFLFSAFDGFIHLLAGVATGLDWVVKKLTGAELGAGDFFKVWGQELDKEGVAKWRNFQQDLAKPWASEGIDQAMKDAQAKIDQARAKLTGGPGLTGSPLGDDEQKKKQAAHKAFGEATTFGSKEAASTILRSKYGEAAETSQRELVASNKRQEELLLQIAQATRQAVAGNAGGALGVFGVI